MLMNFEIIVELNHGQLEEVSRVTQSYQKNTKRSLETQLLHSADISKTWNSQQQHWFVTNVIFLPKLVFPGVFVTKKAP